MRLALHLGYKDLLCNRFVNDWCGCFFSHPWRLKWYLKSKQLKRKIIFETWQFSWRICHIFEAEAWTWREAKSSEFWHFFLDPEGRNSRLPLHQVIYYCRSWADPINLFVKEIRIWKHVGIFDIWYMYSCTATYYITSYHIISYHIHNLHANILIHDIYTRSQVFYI